MRRVILFGAGPLGLNILAFLMDRSDLKLVGVVDLNPALSGKRISELVEGGFSDLVVSNSLEAALAEAPESPDVAVVATVSSIRELLPCIRELAKRKLDIVTTCEEMTYPWIQHPAEAAEIDDICESNGVSILGTGVNPGFLMDYLPAVLSSIHQRVDHVLVERVQDAAARRVSFQKKIGAGFSLEKFERERVRGSLRHVGLPESLHMIAAVMNWNLDSQSETLEPVLAATDLATGYKSISAGELAGVEQVATGSVGGEEKIRLCFRAAVGEEKPFDRILISGNPGAELIIPGGVNGDVATCAIIVNAIRAIQRTGPGLRTMVDVPVPAWSAGTELAATPV